MPISFLFSTFQSDISSLRHPLSFTRDEMHLFPLAIDESAKNEP